MKKTKSAMLIFGLMLILTTILVGSAKGQSSTDYFKIKGDVVNDYKADIYLYAKVDGTWEQVSSKLNKDRYSFRLATNIDYRIVFLGHGASTKVVTIKAGDPGLYLEYVDIDFNKNKSKYAFLEQTSNDRYSFRLEEYYTASLQ